MAVIANAIRYGSRIHREIIEQTYDGVCCIYVMQSVKDPETKATSQKEVLYEEQIPCHLSFSGTSPSAESSTVTAVSQTIKLFLSPELVVPPGSRLEVTQQGITENYSQSGKAAVYNSHQEIMLELWKEYA